MAKTKTAKTARKPKKSFYGMVDFSFGDTQYQIDMSRRKVYCRFIEVETAKTSLIMGAYNVALAEAK